MAAFTFVQGVAAFTATGANPTQAFGSNNTQGNLLIVSTSCLTTLSIGVPIDTLGNTYQQIGATTLYGASNTYHGAVFFAICKSSGANTVTCTSGAGAVKSIGIQEFSGQQVGTNPIDASGFLAVTGTGSSVSLAPVTLSNQNEEVITIYTNAATTFTYTPGSGYTTNVTISTFNSGSRAFAAAGTQTPTATISNGNQGLAISIGVFSTSTPVGGGGSNWLSPQLKSSMRGLRH